VSIQFSTTTGDLDMELTDDTGAQLGNSAGSGDIENIEYSVTSAMDVYVHVFGYNGAVNSYSMNVTTP
jgi:hypothetical protein